MHESNEEKIIPTKKVCLIDKTFFDSLPSYAKNDFYEYDKKVDEFFTSKKPEWKRLLELKDELVMIHSLLKVLELEKRYDQEQLDYLWELYHRY